MSHRKIQCPQCQSTRQKNPGDRPLYVDTATGAAKCFHCDWRGKVDASGQPVAYAPLQPKAKNYRKPDYIAAETENEKLLRWFAGRGIPPAVVKRHCIDSHTIFFPQSNREERAIAFPFFRNGEVVNVQYRTPQKLFRLESDAELILYGVDDIKPDEPLIFTEGQLDKLSCDTAGLTNSVSVPNGAGTNLNVLAGVEKLLAQIPRFIVAGDNDETGQKFQQELIRRLGAEKCWRVSYPLGCKDLNDVLQRFGTDGVREVIEYARPVPLEGVFQVEDVLPDLLDLYRNGRPKGEFVGWKNLAKLYKPRLGTWTVVTGSPNSGKSSLLRALSVNLAHHANWRFLVFPPEDCPPALYFSLLIEIYLGLPFDAGPIPRMSEDEMLAGADWIYDKFIVMNPADANRSLNELLQLTKKCILRHGVNAVVIDPYNRLEHFQPPGMTQEQYICGLLSKFDTFVKNNHLHGFFVAHPTKLKKEANGKYPVATMYDISGAAHWYNMPDFGLSVWRDKEEPQSPIEVHIQKVRNRWCGRLGFAELYFDGRNGRYEEFPTVNEFGARYTYEEQSSDP